MIPVFDGHNDTLLALHDDPDRAFDDAGGVGHVDRARARAGGFAGGLFAMFAPNRDPLAHVPSDDPAVRPPYGPLDGGAALRTTLRLFARLQRLEAEGQLRIVADADGIEAAMADGVLAALPHVEGAEAITDLEVLEVLHRAGLRSLGLTWSRPNAFASGVPFAFPGTPDVGPGLTAAGRALVREAERLRVIVDVSHLNEAGFWDVLDASERPVVASHSNVHRLCPSPRNLTDAQLDALAERDGLVGLNFAVAFLREDGAHEADTPLDVLARHLDALLERLGEDRVAFGSDFDGARVPDAIHDVAGLPRLLEALREHGYGDALLHKIAHRNWVALIRRVQEG
ncbi:MAG: dipeptidase [Trueperaceae bacterium]|nr:dipeptidase [Trueperaceae bacterium]